MSQRLKVTRVRDLTWRNRAWSSLRVELRGEGDDFWVLHAGMLNEHLGNSQTPNRRLWSLMALYLVSYLMA